MSGMAVTSEIYDEFNYQTDLIPKLSGNVISKFPLMVPDTISGGTLKYDEDSDLLLRRRKKKFIIIEHSMSSSLALVGLQVWRGAFLLGDLMVHLGLRRALNGKRVLELGAGTGLSSFVACMYADRVICTDIGDVLGLIKLNATYNMNLMKGQFKTMELDFTKRNYEEDLLACIADTDIVIAADVIYDDDITEAFVRTIQKILNTNPPKSLYMALEKRYVFTVKHMESVAPCYETFLNLLQGIQTKNDDIEWNSESLPINFPQYFVYDRVKELVLWKITSTKKKL